METLVQQIVLLLLVTSVVTILARRLRLPYSVGLVLAGIALTFLHPFDLPISKDLIFTIFLPPLIFEAALFIPWPQLRRDLPVIALFATVGLVLAGAVTAAGMHFIAKWEWQAAIVFGVLIAATDPVSVIATFKEAGAHGRVRLLVEAESLLNDGTAAVGFVVAVGLATSTEAISAGAVAGTLLLSIAGGIACGAIVAGATLFLAWRTDDHLVEIAFSVIIAYSSFLFAEQLHFSGVLSCMTAGLFCGNVGFMRAISPKGREVVTLFWEFIAFTANSFLFILIGIHEARLRVGPLLIPAIAAVLLVLLGRAVAIYPCSLLFARSRLRIPAKHQHILFWGGLRGALALGLALGLPESMPLRSEITTVTFVVVATSVFLQGLTMTPLLRRFGEIPARRPHAAAG